ncbi:Mediator of RNA polymerase II transcription subunit 8 [Cytospora mali]|uniref:Mediator of RNA polymerase II transcription subunit 8 n=1 Tax=Cytospora mali TaxID=578113 RepID=A0A194W447_CYTMA|nr:Mediator of RNA polymerase II transcription subunit 8 [Valsa mali]
MSTLFGGNMAAGHTDGHHEKGPLNLSPEDVRALEATRNRLLQLSNTLGSFKNEIYMSNPLPNPQSLQSSARILNQNMTYLLDILQQHSATFQRVVVYPSPNFPGRTQENVLMQLLRKKLEPQVETLVETGRDVALAAGIDPNTSFASNEKSQQERDRVRQVRRDEELLKYGRDVDEDDDDDDSDDEDDDGENDVNEPIGIGDAWADSRAWCQTRLGEFVRDDFNDSYTAEERALGIENPGGAGPGQMGSLPGEIPERMLWYAARGDRELPPAVELEAQRIVRLQGQRGRQQASGR